MFKYDVTFTSVDKFLVCCDAAHVAASLLLSAVGGWRLGAARHSLTYLSVRCVREGKPRHNEPAAATSQPASAGPAEVGWRESARGGERAAPCAMRGGDASQPRLSLQPRRPPPTPGMRIEPDQNHPLFAPQHPRRYNFGGELSHFSKTHLYLIKRASFIFISITNSTHNSFGC